MLPLSDVLDLGLDTISSDTDPIDGVTGLTCNITMLPCDVDTHILSIPVDKR